MKKIVLSVVVTCSGVAASAATTLPVFNGPGYVRAQGGYANGYLWYTESRLVSGNQLFVSTGKYGPNFSPNYGSRVSRITAGATPQVQELGILNSRNDSYSFAVVTTSDRSGNAYGTASAYSPDGTIEYGSRAVMWPAGSTNAVPLGHFGLGSNGETNQFTDAAVFDVNDNGLAVGQAAVIVNGDVMGTGAARWSAGNPTPTHLQGLHLAPNEREQVTARAVNNAGVIAGHSDYYDPITNAYRGRYAVRWAAGSTVPTRLEGLSEAANGIRSVEDTVWEIDDAGNIAATLIKYSPSGDDLGMRAVRWDAGSTTATELGLLGVRSNGTSFSSVESMNDRGDIVGLSARYDINGNSLEDRPVIWKVGTNTPLELQALDTDLDGLPASAPRAVNNLQRTVGTSWIFDDVTGNLTARHAALWMPDGRAIDLNDYLVPNSGWVLLGDATAISDVGWVSGYGRFDADGSAGPEPYYLRYFLMLIPEAGTYGMGDANFDEAINFDDLLTLAQHYSQPNPTKATTVGDFNLDGATDFADLLALAQHYQAGPSLAGVDAGFAADWALAQAMTPEPVSLGVLCLALANRRRRRD